MAYKTRRNTAEQNTLVEGKLAAVLDQFASFFSGAQTIAAPAAVAATTEKSEDFDLFGDEGADNKEYEEMMAKKKAEADAVKAKEKKEKKVVVLKSAVVLDVKPAEAEVRLYCCVP